MWAYKDALNVLLNSFFNVSKRYYRCYFKLPLPKKGAEVKSYRKIYFNMNSTDSI